MITGLNNELNKSNSGLIAIESTSPHNYIYLIRKNDGVKTAEITKDNKLKVEDIMFLNSKTLGAITDFLIDNSLNNSQRR